MSNVKEEIKAIEETKENVVPFNNIRNEFFTRVGNTVVCTLVLKNGKEISECATALTERLFDEKRLSEIARNKAVQTMKEYESYRKFCEHSNFYEKKFYRVTNDKEGNPVELKDTDIVSVSYRPFKGGRVGQLFINYKNGKADAIIVNSDINFLNNDEGEIEPEVKLISKNHYEDEKKEVKKTSNVKKASTTSTKKTSTAKKSTSTKKTSTAKKSTDKD